MPNQVVLSFAGETKNLEAATARAGASVKRFGDDAGEAAGGLHRAGEAADAGERKAQGFADVLDGSIGIGQGYAQVMSGDVVNGLISAGRGVADLAGGMADFLIPALQSTKVGTLATAAAQRVAAGASRVWAAGQWLLNTALLASPITWIIVGIVALVAVVYLIATRTTWFQTVWRVAWGAITAAARNAWSFIRQIPGWIASAFSTVAGAITAPFRSAFNFIAQAWNNTLGGLSFSIPSWVPGIGGNGFSVPRIPYFHAGGTVPGAPGQNVLTMLQAGERVTSAAGAGAGQTIVLQVAGETVGEVILDGLRSAVRSRGGNVQAVLGRG